MNILHAMAEMGEIDFKKLYMDISNIIDRLEFIKGHVIADDRQHAMQQIKELLQILREEEINQLNNQP